MRGPCLPIALLAIVLFAPVAAAQPDAGGSARARVLFEQAMAAMDDGSYDLAIEQLDESLALTPRPATAFNLALALRGAGRTSDAIAVLEALLAGAHGTLRAPQRRAAEELRTEASADLATVRVRVGGASELELRIDGVRIDAEAGAWNEQRVDPGAHVITASAPDHATIERSITLPRAGSSELDLTLMAALDTRPGTLVLESSDPALIVEIEGVASATGTLRRELPPGEYVVRVIAGDARRDSRIEVPPGRTVRLALEPPTSSRSIAEEPWLWLTLGAVVLVGGGLAIGAGVALDSQRASPLTDPVFPVIETLSW